MMLNKLNGWQRLWVLASGISFLLATLNLYIHFPAPESTPHNTIFIKNLSKKNKNLLVAEDKEGWQKTDEVGTDVEMPNKHILSFKKNISEQEMSGAAQEYWSLVTTEANANRVALISLYALLWLSTSIGLYILGWSLNWVLKGFKKNE